MDTVDLIIKSSTEFYNDLKSDENGRYRSWEHCYSHFMNARGRNDVDYDYLSLQLAFSKLGNVPWLIIFIAKRL